MQIKQDKHYLSNKEMLKEINECKEVGLVSDKLGRMFILLSQRYATKPNFAGYSYKDEMVSNGIVSCTAAFEKFDSNKSNNPFAYFTQCIHHAFLQVLNKEKRHQRLRDQLLVDQEKAPSQSYIDHIKEKEGDDTDARDQDEELS